MDCVECCVDCFVGCVGVVGEIIIGGFGDCGEDLVGCEKDVDGFMVGGVEGRCG